MIGAIVTTLMTGPLFDRFARDEPVTVPPVAGAGPGELVGEDA